MKIYTKTGDAGQTSLLGGMRISKDATQIEAYGTIDELNAWLGLIRSEEKAQELHENIFQIQQELFQIGAELALSPDSNFKKSLKTIDNHSIERLEKWIDETEATLEPLKNFVLAGANTNNAQLHIARTICRRAERILVKLASEITVNQTIIQYLNRLSDLLFVWARKVCKTQQSMENLWNPA